MMKRLSEDLDSLFTTTAEMRASICTCPKDAEKLESVGLLDKTAEHLAVAFNKGIEGGVKLVILRNFEKQAECGKGSPADKILGSLLVTMDLSSGKEKGKTPTPPAENFNYPRPSHPNQRTQEDQPFPQCTPGMERTVHTVRGERVTVTGDDVGTLDVRALFG